MSTRNHIEFYRNKVDYHKYRDEINGFINKIVHEFLHAFIGCSFKSKSIIKNSYDLYDDRVG